MSPTILPHSLEKEAFLNNDEEATLIYQESDKDHLPILRHKSIHWPVSKYWILYVILFLIYTAIFIKVSSSVASQARPGNVQLPLSARSSLHQEIRYFPTALRNNAFTGEPRPELDLAWHNLLANDNIRVLSSEVANLNLTSIEIADGSGMTAQLGIFHALHCLKKIRHWIYKDYYFGDATEHALWEMAIHVDHCIEYVRESLMCHPDISLVTHHWIMTDEGWKPTNEDSAPHECVNWDALNDWAGGRVVDLYRLNRLKQPSSYQVSKGK